MRESEYDYQTRVIFELQAEKLRLLVENNQLLAEINQLKGEIDTLRRWLERNADRSVKQSAHTVELTAIIDRLTAEVAAWESSAQRLSAATDRLAVAVLERNRSETVETWECTCTRIETGGQPVLQYNGRCQVHGSREAVDMGGMHDMRYRDFFKIRCPICKNKHTYDIEKIKNNDTIALICPMTRTMFKTTIRIKS